MVFILSVHGVHLSFIIVYQLETLFKDNQCHFSLCNVEDTIYAVMIEHNTSFKTRLRLI